MNKKLLELLNQISAKKTEITNFVNENKLEEAKAAKTELAELQSKFDLLKDVLDNKDPEPLKPVDPATPKDSTKEFANAVRAKFTNVMKEGVPADGGYTVPEDIQTKINKYREARKSLKDLVKVEAVKTSKGSRTFQKRSQKTGFAKVGEGGKIGEVAGPKFERIDYEIGKYAGYLPITDELLADSDANITSVIVEWIGDQSRVTCNKEILKVVAQKEITEFKGIDDIKKAANVTLGQAFKSTAKVITNDDGLQYLDTLKDSDGKYLLQPSPVDPMQMYLCAGATKLPVEVFPNADMPSDTNTSQTRKIPMIVGDLKEAIVMFDRQKTSLKTSTQATVGTLNAFEEDLTIFRAIEREDFQARDLEAIVNGQIKITDKTVVGA